MGKQTSGSRVAGGRTSRHRGGAAPGTGGGCGDSRVPDPMRTFPNLVEVIRFPTPVLSPGGAGEWDEKDIHSHFVIRSGPQVFLYYNGLPEDRSDRGIGLAISEDGVRFRKHGSKPILPVGKRGEWDSGHLWKMDVIRITPKDWRMWYGGFEEGDASMCGRIGYATSADGIHWEKHPGNPVLEPGNARWEQGCVADLRVVYDQFHQRFHGLYYGCPRSVRPSAIGYAYSPDGVHWSRHAENPVMTPAPGGSEGDLISPKHLLRIGDAYALFYEALHGGKAMHTGNAVAYSYDLVHWARDPRNPFQADSSAEMPVDPSLLMEDGWFANYYGAIRPNGGFLGLAYCVTGASRKLSYPVLALDSLAASSASRLDDSVAVDLAFGKALCLTVEAAYDPGATRGIVAGTYASANGRDYDTAPFAVVEQTAAPGTTVRCSRSIPSEARWLKVVVENPDGACPARRIAVAATVQAP